MKKRFLCALLTLIMLISLVPTTALTASAASMTTSESAITVLKQWNGYKKNCGADGNTGYGTKCEVKATHGAHAISEKQADTALRNHLKGLETAVNSFASKNGVALSQNQFDALILFTFDNGTAWTTGTGSMKSAVVSGLKGSEFLNAICRWNATESDDKRRMVEANMYLNGVYSSTAPYNYILLKYDANGGSLNGSSNMQYYDTTLTRIHAVSPVNGSKIFMGWYVNNVLAYEVSSRYAGNHVLVARWQEKDKLNDTAVSYSVSKSELAAQKVYDAPNGKEVTYTLTDTISADRDFIDGNNFRWIRIKGTPNWVVLGKAGTYGTTVTNPNAGVYVDVIVTVTNDYVRSRVNETQFSAQNGTYHKGDQLRIINTASGDGFLWGQVAKSADDNTPIGWVALMYTNWESVKDSGKTDKLESTTAAVATATIKVSTNNGYVNIRNGAGTHNTIVGAIANGTKVTLLETKYVNGHQWGRTDSGWFCLTYADITWLKQDTSYATDEGLLSYVFSAKKGNNKVTITKLMASNGKTMGLIAGGDWVDLSTVTLDTAKYIVTADTATVRDAASLSANRVDTLVKGVEFNVNEVVVVDDTIWGHAKKVNASTYAGWVELSGTQVSRQDMPTLGTGSSSSNVTSNKMATVVNTDNVNVRAYTDATYAKVGSLSRGTVVNVWDEEDGWYKVDSNKNGKYDEDGDGWVSAKYLDVYTATSSSDNAAGGSSATGAVETGLGVIANTYTGVNVRTGAGTGYAQTGKILAGTTVEIQEVKAAGASKWGRVAQGWICMDYVTMISKYPVAGATGNTSGSASGTTSNTTASEAVIFTGNIIGSNVKVYKSSNTSSEEVRTLSTNDPITVHELLIAEESTVEEMSDGKTVTTTEKKYWARINDGYILNPVDSVVLNPLAEKTYTVTSYAANVDNELKVYNEDCATVKAGPTLNKYEQVSVTVLKIKGIELWCRVEFTDHDGNNQDGYVNMKHLTQGTVQDPDKAASNNNAGSNTTAPAPTTPVIGSTGNTANQGTNGFVNNNSGYRYTGKIIRTNSVNVRANPSQTAGLTTTLKSGAALVIYETVVNEGMAWGRCDAGWVYLYYVDLQPCNTAVDAKVVYNENTIAYTDANCTAVAGTYARMSVVDIFEQVGNMCRTELGWVHIDNLG